MDKAKKNEQLASFIGEKIKFYRKAKKITQAALGKKINKSDNTISNYEKGIVAPSQDALFALAEALEVTIDDFFPKRNNPVTLQNALSSSNENFDSDDIHFLQNLMSYISSLDENNKKQLLGNIEVAVELFKKREK